MVTSSTASLVVVGNPAINEESSTVTVVFDIVNGVLDLDTVLDEIDGATIRYLSKGTTRARNPYARYELQVKGDAVRCSVIEDAIMSILEGDTLRHRACVTQAAQLL